MNNTNLPRTSSTIASFRRRQRRGPTLLYLIAALMIIGALLIFGSLLVGPGKPLSNLFASDTPTPTPSFTPTNTLPPSATPTETATPTITPTGTPSAPFEYTVQEGDYLSTIADKFQLGDDGIPLILLLNPYGGKPGLGIDPATSIVYPGQILFIPNPGMQLPTATPIPPDLPRGTKVPYIVQAGDTLAGIAALFNSTVDAIIKENDLTDPNAIYVGQQLIIPVNLVTPTATRPPTSTPITATPTFPATATKSP